MRRLVLFDIDGTLVRGGPAKDAFRVAMVATFGTAGPIVGHEFSGKTDPQIARELLRAAGLEDGEIDAGFPELWRRYLAEMEARLEETPMEVLPGVAELLDVLDGVEGVALGLLTGNIVEGARLKLGSVGFAERFPVGGFGSDDEERDRLPAVAIGRAEERWSVEFEPARVTVVGDTPRDVACGLRAGTRTVAVATGRFDRGALQEAGAHRIFDDFSVVDEVMGVLMG